MNTKMIVDPKGMNDLMKKLNALGDYKELIHKGLKKTARDIRNSARSDFEAGKGDPSGLRSNIRYRTIKGRKAQSGYEVTTNAERQPIMAYIEFGTRSKGGGTERMDFIGISKVFGSAKGRSIARGFKKNNPKKFTGRYAKPYFYENAFREYKAFEAKMKSELRKAIMK